MLYDKILNELGAESMSFEKKRLHNSLPDDIKISESLNKLLDKFNTAIVFSNGAKFKTPKKMPIGDKDGFVFLDVIYGLAPDSNNIYYKNEMYANQIRSDLYTFGESGGGDQFCINKNTEEVYYWYHEAKDDASSLFLIAPSFAHFFEHLIPDNDETNSKDDDGIVSAEFNF
ncbi:SMI1/KNR4 family protein [Pseudomonas prosekii]|uniref:SMI1/KNR4 family protein n=1 Tax=Pseudomonas prosekii TaxID=1148509 RepID=A0A3L8C9Y6_9PSED|nr:MULTISPECIES: SMI1/KNR4 family protein [Pseudomonas]RLU05035.1 SMI1/KNR4 family protein [Pseudomonas prosekii]RLU05410.1 SMI1/KNR4 family protein [Pseudomonas prosekii]TWD43617.1 SMI1/KNR4 family protein SUKH-1 [Pseudomonas sp. SJZ131]